MVTKVIYFFLLSTVTIFSIVGCTAETSATQEVAQTLMKEDNNSDIFLIESILYKKVKTVNETEFKSVNTTSYGQISMNYNKNKKFQSGMASVLPIGTKLYRSVENPEYVYSSEERGYTMYKSVPEG
ncbi:hypothetical protein [Paenibacillus xylanivorans]|jgi:hypothetical protein|uniref:Lipoprotein n=1 Tax=Paenibacillus xylanivorans TaxID=1705561 RepID=A0A0M9BIN4_9BACL|nr:hypothetical protein [Paenibacillus xylanivorans]KOY13068.1 hypothetical protein AMS66_29045 [Paenibacillus xylanivorans]